MHPIPVLDKFQRQRFHCSSKSLLSYAPLRGEVTVPAMNRRKCRGKRSKRANTDVIVNSRAEPLKKKKRLDPGVEKQRLEKKKKRIMKEIRRLQRLDKQLKPVAELETPDCLINDLERRIRQLNVPEETAEERIRLLKEWSRYKLKENVSYLKLLQRLTKSQQMALDELRLESEELYQAAVQIDPKLIPLKYSGPTETPAKEDYPIPDGAYVDVSRKWI